MSRYQVNISGLTSEENAHIAAALASGQEVTLYPDDGEIPQVADVQVIADDAVPGGDDDGYSLDANWGDEFTPSASDDPFSFW